MRILSLCVLILISYSSFTLSHKRVLLACRQLCVNFITHQRVTAAQYSPTIPLLEARRDLTYLNYSNNHDTLALYRQITQGATTQMFLTQHISTQQLKILTCHIQDTDLPQLNYILNQLGYPTDWVLLGGNSTASVSPYFESRDMASIDFSFRDIKVVIYKIVLELNKAHHKGIIHTDVKPSNILVHTKMEGRKHITSTGKVRIIGWNSAELYYSGKRSRKEVGTQGYRAPQLCLYAEYYTPAVDVWSLGVSMYEAITHQSLIHVGGHLEVESLTKLFGIDRWMSFYKDINIKIDPFIHSHVAKNANQKDPQLNKTLSNKRLSREQAEFLSRVLVLEPWNRPSLGQLLDDSYFFDVRHLHEPMYYKLKQKEKKAKQKEPSKEGSNDISRDI